MDANDFATKYGVTFDWSATGYQRDEQGWEHHAYVVTLEANGRTFESPWKQGLALDDEPTVAVVLPVLVTEAQMAEADFDEHCDEFGLDNDSRKVYAQWEEGRAARARLYDWCQSEAMWDDLLTVREDD